MPSPGRSPSSAPSRSSARPGSKPRQSGLTSGGPQPPAQRGPGFVAPLILALLLGGAGILLVRSGALSGGGLPLVGDTAATCPGPLNRWADQRLLQRRRQLERDHALYRSPGASSNAVSAALLWVDDRIIDQQLAAERQQIRSSLLRSPRCLVAFQP